MSKLLAQEEVWIRKGVEARRTRSVARIGRLEVLRDGRASRRDAVGRVNLDVSSGEKSGKIVAELTEVSKSYGHPGAEKIIVNRFSGLRLLAAGTRQLTPLHPHERTFKEKLAVLSCHAPQALLVAPDFDAAPALSALCHQAAREWPDAFGWDGAIASAAQLGWSVRHDTPVALGESAPSEIGACLAGLPSGWRLAGLLALAFAEDLAIVDARRGRIAWLAVCLPSHWAPEEKIGRSFAEVHAPVADNALLVKAGDALIKLVSAGERWERFVWTVTAHAHLRAHPHAHPQLLARRPAPDAPCGGPRFAASPRSSSPTNRRPAGQIGRAHV